MCRLLAYVRQVLKRLRHWLACGDQSCSYMPQPARCRITLFLESGQHAYFKVVPQDSVRRVGKSLEEVLYQLVQLIISLPAEARPEAIDGESRQMVQQALTSLDCVAAITQKHCPDQESVECFRIVQETCQRVRDSHFATPTLVMAADSPDHKAPRESTTPEEWEIITEGSVD